MVEVVPTETRGADANFGHVIQGEASPFQIAQARADWIKAGLDVAKFDATVGDGSQWDGARYGERVAPPPTPKDAPSGTTDSPEPLEIEAGSFGPDLSRDQMLTLAADLRAAGVAPEKIAEALKAEGIAPPVERSAADIAHDAEHGIDAGHSPAEYRIDLAAVGIQGMPAQSQLVWINEARQFAADLNLDAGLGAALVEDLARTTFAYDKMPPTEQVFWLQQQSVTLARLIGKDTDAAKEVGHALSFATNKDFASRVAKAPLSAFFRASLVHHSRNLAAWRAGLKA